MLTLTKTLYSDWKVSLLSIIHYALFAYNYIYVCIYVHMYVCMHVCNYACMYASMSCMWKNINKMCLLHLTSSCGHTLD